MNGMEARKLDIPLRFLEADRQYTAHIYEDAPGDDDTRTHVAIRRRAVNRNSVLSAQMPASGGQAVRIVPAGRHGRD